LTLIMHKLGSKTLDFQDGIYERERIRRHGFLLHYSRLWWRVVAEKFRATGVFLENSFRSEWQISQGKRI